MFPNENDGFDWFKVGKLVVVVDAAATGLLKPNAGAGAVVVGTLDPKAGV